MIKSDGALDIDVEWPSDPATEAEVKEIVCMGLESSLQTAFCTGRNDDDCEARVLCNDIVRRRLDGTKSKLLHRGLVTATAPFTVQLVIECEGVCSDPANLEKAIATMGQIKFDGGQVLTDQFILNMIAVAVLNLDPPPSAASQSHLAAFQFLFDPTTLAIENPTTTVVPDFISGYQFFGKGYCIASNGKSYGYVRGNPDGNNSFTSAQCANWCDGIRTHACWTQKKAIYPYIGFDYEPFNSNYCWCLFQVTTGDPKDICPHVGYTSNSGGGIGPVYYSSGSNGYVCFKFTAV